MRARLAKTTAVVVLAVLAAAPGLLAEEAAQGTGLEREVRALNATLGQLVELLRSQLESSNAGVLMQRVQLMTQRIAPLADELRTARGEERDLAAQIDELELSASSFESQLERQVEAGDLSAEDARALVEQQLPLLEQRRKQIEDRLWTVRQRAIDLEQRLTARRDEIATWEAEIDRALGLR